jgi:hypothetical protein
VRYVDRKDVGELRREYPELADEELVDVDVVDDGETLGTVADSSQDFVVASHVLEHAQDARGTLESLGDVDPAVLTHHALGAGDAPRVLRYATLAGAAAARAGAHTQAARCFALSLEHGVPDSEA